MDENPPSGWKRRSFFAGLMMASGAALGWGARRWSGPSRPAAPGPTVATRDAFSYDVSEHEQIDPALLLHEPSGSFPTRMARPKRVETLSDGSIAVIGDASLHIHDETGRLRRRVDFARAPHCLRVIGREEMLVGFADHYAVWTTGGREMFRSPSFGDRTYLTGIDARDDRVFLADAGHREVLVCMRDNGRVLDRFGQKSAARGNPGFNVPSPYFDLAMAPDGQLRVVNPGFLRVETYTTDGRCVSSWGEPGMRIDRFCGCCNPVYFKLTPAGDFITSEKGLARIKMYRADGGFQGVVAGPATLVDDKALAKRACRDCRIGAGFDVAVQENGEVLALDPFRKTVRRFHPKSAS